jgi:HK97 family phage major capsid protein
MMNYKEELLEARGLIEQAKVLYTKADRSQEDVNNANTMLADAKALQEHATKLQGIDTSLDEIKRTLGAPAVQEYAYGFKSLREFLAAVVMAGDIRMGPETLHPGLKTLAKKAKKLAVDDSEKESWTAGDAAISKEFKATMVEAIGARGGFLVPDEFLAQMYALDPMVNIVRSRATIIPMRRRAVRIPALDQTGTTANKPHWFGGIYASWTEEGGAKAQYDPTFRQIELVAYKLVCYTRSSDELLDDAAIGLEAFLMSSLGFPGAIAWEEEWCFLRGTGVGQPLGIIPAGATITVPAAADALGVVDLANMLENFLPGGRGVWIMSQTLMSNLIQLNGPAGNPSYVFIPSAREGVPGTLFGMPIFWSEKLPTHGETGAIILADLRYYLIGDRQATTVESSNQERFRYDETSWRAVHRVDGQPWLSAPYTLADGTAQVSPFVILGVKAS